MADQRIRFLRGEGDAYHARNASSRPRADEDPLLTALAEILPAPGGRGRVLEIGCGDGWRLDELAHRLPDWHRLGLDPSHEALCDGTGRGSFLVRGTAERLPFRDGAVDLLCFGFCLYLCDPRDLPRIAAEADRVLADGGHVAIYDFDSPRPRRNPYRHGDGLFSHKMDFSAMFAWNPCYRLVSRRVGPHPGAAADDDDARIAVTILRRLPELAFRDDVG